MSQTATMARKVIKTYDRDWQGQRGQINYVLHFADDFGGFRGELRKQAYAYRQQKLYKYV